MLGPFLSLALLIAPPGPLQETGAPKGLIHRTEAAQEGYTLFQPLHKKTTYLIDLVGEVVHEWRGEFTPGQSNYLLDDGTLLRACKDEAEPFRSGGVGGRIQRVAPDGSLLWNYDLASEVRSQHHDIEPLPNGNVLALCWEARTREEAIAQGRDPERIGDALWSEVILELKPVGADGAEVVWRWDVFDHLVQDHSADRANYGKVEEHPHRVDINMLLERPVPTDEDLDALAALGYAGGGDEDEDEEAAREAHRRALRSDWIHLNAVDFDSETERIVVSARSLGEVWVIPYGTTTEEAAGPGGDLVGRFGNPRTWQPNSTDDPFLFAPHDARWIDGPDGERHVLVFNNGERRPGGHRSSADEYRLTEWGAELVWTYGCGEGDEEFFSPIVSGATRLANGNTLLCAGITGRMLEVTPSGELVWEYRNPFPDDTRARPPQGGPPGDRPRREGGRGPGGRGGSPFSGEGSLVRAERYGPDHPGVKALFDAR